MLNRNQVGAALIGIILLTPAFVVAQESATAPPPKAAKALQLELSEKLVGEWKFLSVTRGGQKAPDDRLKAHVILTREKLTLKSGDGDFEMKYELDTVKTPAQVKFTITASPFGGEGMSTSGIVQITDDGKMHVCYAEEGAEAPTKFASPEGKTDRYIVLERVDSK